MVEAKTISCPHCGARIGIHRNPFPTVDLIIQCRVKGMQEGIVLVYRKNPPHGWALPGGFVDYGESLEQAAQREAREETGLEVKGLKQFHAYSEPDRDPRQHNITVVFLAKAEGLPQPGDDAKACKIFALEQLPPDLAFDHGRILADYSHFQKTGRAPWCRDSSV